MGKSIRVVAAACWLALLLALPVRAAGPEALVPVGKTVGLELETDGLYVAALEDDSPAGAAGLRVGDRLLRADGRALDQVEVLREQLEQACGGAVIVEAERDGRPLQFAVRPQLRDGIWRLGLRVRDRIGGLGTLTFYDPASGLFGALGHGVSAGEGCLMEIRGGQASETEVREVRQGRAGTPGSLLGPTGGGTALGRVELNTERGLFGHAAKQASGNGSPFAGTALPLADRSEVRTGPAEILCCVEGSAPTRYTVEIEAVRLDAARCRDLRLLVTDSRLLARTGGIVQGMSGSPILQNGKLVGAVTHVLVRDPTRGYGILIGHMLEAAEDRTAAEDRAA